MGKYLIESPAPDHMVRPGFDIATLPELIAQTCHRQSGHTAIQWREDAELKRITYSQLWTRVESLARAMLENGFGGNG